MNSTEINSTRTSEINSGGHSAVATTSTTSKVVTTLNRTTMINTLAIVGFIALVGATMWLAVYSTRFVPSVVSRIGTAAVYLGSVFTPSPAPSLSVVPTASTTIAFGEASSTLSTSTSTTTASAPKAPVRPVEPTAGKQTTGAYQIAGATSTALYGLPDFIVTINAVGYLATSSAGSFVASSTVPNGGRPAVSFTIKNIGTNATGAWRFSASIPTQSAYIYQSQAQQSLNPGDSIDYTLGFDQANKGANQMISITANFDHAVAESNINNDSASATLTILGN